MSDKKTFTENHSNEGIIGICAIANHYNIHADPASLTRELLLEHGEATTNDILRAANFIKMKARVISNISEKRLINIPLPALCNIKENGYMVIVKKMDDGSFILFSPRHKKQIKIEPKALLSNIDKDIILIQRGLFGKGTSPDRKILEWFKPTLKRYKKPLIYVFIASFFIQIFALITPLFFQVVIDKVLVSKSQDTLIVIVSGLMIIAFFEVALRYLRGWILNHTGNRIDVELGRKLFSHLFSLPISYFETRNAGSTVARIRELENIRNFFTSQAVFSIIDLFFVVILLSFLFLYSVKLSLILLCSIPFYLLITISLRKPIKSRIDRKVVTAAENQQVLIESIIGAQTIKASAVEPLFKKEWEEKLAAYMNASFEASQFSSAGQNSILLVNKIFTSLLLFFGATAVIFNQLTVGQYIAFNMISGQFVQPVLRLSQLWQEFQQVEVSMERLQDILYSKSEFYGSQNNVRQKVKGDIKFENVNFHWSDQTTPTLKNINISIKEGDTIGIVGASGSGKSTLTKIIQRLHMPTSGTVYIDGVDIIHTDPAWLRSHIGVVLQENILFNRTLHENIAFSKPTLPRDQVIAAAILAGADDFIRKLPQGYDTVIEERGSNLSGGQRQRIAIARALVTNPPLLILDEATSALDYESENIIKKNMKKLCEGRTVIIIAHRLSTVRQCSKIISMENGEIVETGTHEELSKANGVYSRLLALQNNFDENN